jgi:hypothetical protein
MSDSIYTQHQPEGSGDGLYLKLKDGDSFVLRVMSDPVITVYKEGDRPRYAWIVYNHTLKKVQVYAAGVSVYGQLAGLIEDWGEPSEFDVRIKREGSGVQDTTYTVTPVKKSTEPPAEAAAEVEKIDLPNATKGKWLSAYVEDKELPNPVVLMPQTEDEPAPSDEDEPIKQGDIPF